MLLEHKYGDSVRILDDPFISSLLTPFSTNKVKQPLLTSHLKLIYEHLCSFALTAELPAIEVQTDTRMSDTHPDKPLTSKIFDPSQKVVSVDLARAGMLPSQVCFEMLNQVLPPENIRQDHVWAARTVNDKGEVTGTRMDGSKVGGGVKDATVIVPDPMGATGGTMEKLINYYETEIGGGAQQYIGLFLIITPEFLKRVTAIPKLKVYACRLDRGLSSQEVLDSIPGTHWDKEKGLNQNSYIVPGAGGVGELLNNAFV